MTPIDVALRTAVAGVLESQRVALEREQVRAITVAVRLTADGSPAVVDVRLDRGTMPCEQRPVGRSAYLAAGSRARSGW